MTGATLPSRSGQLLVLLWSWLCLQCFNLSVKARLVPGGLVFLDDAVRNSAIDDRYSAQIDSRCRVEVAGIHSGNRPLDCGT